MRLVLARKERKLKLDSDCGQIFLYSLQITCLILINVRKKSVKRFRKKLDQKITSEMSQDAS